MDTEPISLSSSPKFSVLIFKPQKHKLYSKGLINVTGSFLFIDNNNKKTSDTDVFFNLQTLTVDIDRVSFDINISTLQMENQTSYIYDKIMCTNIVTCGETLQREFYIPSSENITIKIIKSIHKYNNVVEITNVQNMKKNNTEKISTLSKPVFIPRFLEHLI